MHKKEQEKEEDQEKIASMKWMQNIFWAVQGSQGEVDTEETPLKRSSPKKELEKSGQKGSETESCWGHPGKHWGRGETSWSEEHKGRSWQGWVTGCADVKRRRGKPIPDLPLCHSGFTRDALWKGCQGRPPQAIPTPQKSWSGFKVNWTSHEMDLAARQQVANVSLSLC